MPRLLDDPPDSTLIKDSTKRIRDQLAHVPEGKTAAWVTAIDWKFGVVPVVRSGIAARIGKNWEIHGEGFLSAVDKGVSARILWTR